jgi:Recombinase zinc beta ribbon domain
MRGIAELDRRTKSGSWPYLLRGLIRCAACGRKMQGAKIRERTFYRCTCRSLVPGSAALEDHPKTVNLREDRLVPPLNEWIGTLFAPEHLDDTVAQLVTAQAGLVPEDHRRADAERRLTAAESRLRRYQTAIEAGVDPSAFVEAINGANEERAAARAELAAAPPARTLTEDDVRAMLRSIGDISGSSLRGPRRGTGGRL